MSTKRLTDASCIPADGASAPLAPAVVLVFVLPLVMGIADVLAADRPSAGKDCVLVRLDGDTTASTGAPMALADITVCYRALPEDFWSPVAPVLRAQATRPVAAPASMPADATGVPVAAGKPDRT
jgi:hypothetical protein